MDRSRKHPGPSPSLPAGAALLLALCVGACDAGGTAPATVAAVLVTPDTVTIGTTASRTFQARVLAPDGSLVGGAAVGWTSSNPEVAAVDATGKATAEGEGTTTIRASFGGVEGEARLTVALLPASALPVGGDGQAPPRWRPRCRSRWWWRCGTPRGTRCGGPWWRSRPPMVASPTLRGWRRTWGGAP